MAFTYVAGVHMARGNLFIKASPVNGRTSLHEVYFLVLTHTFIIYFIVGMGEMKMTLQTGF